MKQIEKNIIDSFNLAKNDIHNMSAMIVIIEESLQKINSRISKLESKVNVKPKVTKVTKSKKSKFFASKTGKKFHTKNCPFGQNIKPKSRITFKTKTTALNNNYKPCSCIN